MRDFKFRAWHIGLKHMYFDVRVSSVSWATNDTHFGGEHSTLMQFTGLIDKNAKEIYEGDICIVYLQDGLREIMVVKWDEGSCGFRFNGSDGGFWRITHTPIEVIGNIYENPELLREV